MVKYGKIGSMKPFKVTNDNFFNEQCRYVKNDNSIICRNTCIQDSHYEKKIRYVNEVGNCTSI